MMKKILFMVSSLNVGGVEKSLTSLLAEIPKEKYEITVLVLDKKGEFLEYIPEWVNVEEASWFKKIKAIIMQPPQTTIKEYFENKQYLKILFFICSYFTAKYSNNRYFYYKHVFKSVPKNQTKYDVAIAYQGPTDTIDYYIANKVNAKKKVSWVHFDVSKFPINKKLYTQLYKRFNKVFVVSQEAKQCLIETIPTVKNKAEVFFNTISSSIINQMSKEAVDLDYDFNGTKIVTVGRLSKEKGQDLAIQVLYKLRQEGYNVKWYCVGEGVARKEYERSIDKYNLQNYFILLGATVNPYPYIKQSDIYVQTSRHEGYCLTLAEARCLLKPIVTTNFTGAYEQVTDGDNGFIVEPDPKQLYKKIKYLLDNPEQRNKLINSLSQADVDTTCEVHKLFDYIERSEFKL